MKSEKTDTPCIDRDTEGARILEMCGGHLIEAMAVLERQMNTLHSRAQVLFSFCGIVVTVTGFSGRLIAATSRPAQILIVAGLTVVIGCAFYLYSSVMTLRWNTQRLDVSPDRTINAILARRDLKTRAYKRGGYFLFAGLSLYALAISMMLLNPEPMTVPAR